MNLILLTARAAGQQQSSTNRQNRRCPVQALARDSSSLQQFHGSRMSANRGGVRQLGETLGQEPGVRAPAARYGRAARVEGSHGQDEPLSQGPPRRHVR